MRRRTKPRVVWLPPSPTNRIGNLGGELADTAQAIPGVAGFNLPTGVGEYTGLIVPVVGDAGNTGNFIVGASSNAYNHSLSDLFSSGYRLRRICGHIWPNIAQVDNGNADAATNFVVTVGFQVQSTEESGVPANGSEGAPDIYATQENPWIWRRSWLLSNYSNQPTAPKFGLAGPSQGGFSIREGSFIDQKTARVVGPDQRLFMSLSATALDGSGQGANSQIIFFWNFRVLASLKSNLGNRRNASR